MIPPIKHRKLVIAIVIILIVTIFYGYAFFQDHKAKQKFYISSFSGKVIEKRHNTYNRGSTSLRLTNNEWQNLSIIYYDDQKFIIEIGDSILKERNSFNIFLIKKDGTINNCVRERFVNKTFNRGF